MSEDILLAIDPGANGGYMARTNKVVITGSLPDTEGDILELIEKIIEAAPDANRVAYLEDLIKFTGSPMPASAMAVYASSWGILKGFLMANKFRLILTHPKKWQKDLGLGTSKGKSKTEWKNSLKSEAQRYYPHHKITLANADAALIYRFAEQQERTNDRG